MALISECTGIIVPEIDREAYMAALLEKAYPQIPLGETVITKTCIIDYRICFYSSLLRTRAGAKSTMFLDETLLASLEPKMIQQFDAIGVEIKAITDEPTLPQKVEKVVNISSDQFSGFLASIPDERWDAYESSIMCGGGLGACLAGLAFVGWSFGALSAPFLIECGGTAALCSNAVRKVAKYVVWKEKKVKAEREKAEKERAEKAEAERAAAAAGGGGGGGDGGGGSSGTTNRLGPIVHGGSGPDREGTVTINDLPDASDK